MKNIGMNTNTGMPSDVTSDGRRFINITELINAGEGFHIEFKESFDKSLIEEVCAFANSGGGIILLGVSDKGLIKGINNDNKLRSMIQDVLRNLQPFLDIQLLFQDNVIIVDVPEGNEKPYACSKGFFIRNGANTQKLTRNEIIEFFQKEGKFRFDELKNEKAIFQNDFDDKAFDEFLRLAKISNTIDKMSLLKNLDCLTDDNKLTNAGTLFFAKDIDFLINQAVVVCVLYKGTEKLNILDKKNFSGNLVENINNAIVFVKRNTNTEYKIEYIQREEIPDIPDVALRESIINAICHRDYFDKRSNVMIEVFENKVIITNPGGLPSGLKESDFGKKSIARNPIIASLLHRIDYIEKIGTGINRIKESVKENGRCSVGFLFTDFFEVTFLWAQSKIGEGLSEGLNEGLSEGLNLLLQVIIQNPGIQTKRLSEILKRPVKTLERQIKYLADNAYIERIGSKKTGGYFVKNGK